MKNPAELHPYFQALEREDRFSGVVRITQGEHEIFAGAYGYASRPWQVPNTLATRFDTASITKLFTAVAVLQMIDEGRLAFETRVVPELELHGTAISPDVNVFHLLTHSSGIGDDADEEAGESYEALWKTKPNYSVVETVDFVPQCVHRAANFAPGKGCRYCNCGYVLLGLLVERASGMTYRDYVRRKIFAPAGMTDSDFFQMDRVTERVAEGSDPIRAEGGPITGWRKNIYAFPPIGSPDSGAHVTAGDLDRFLRRVAAGDLLSDSRTAEFFTPQVHYGPMPGGTMKYGYGLWVCVDGAGRVLFAEKEGINTGVSGLVRRYFDRDLNVVVLSNMEQGAWEPIRKIHEVLSG